MWWVLTGVLVALELTTGSFYLLMLGLGTAAAALAAMAGYGLSAQLVAAAAVGGLGVVLLGQWRKRQAITPQEAQDQHLDLGATVLVRPGMRKARRRSSTEGPFGALCTPRTRPPRQARTAFRP